MKIQLIKIVLATDGNEKKGKQKKLLLAWVPTRKHKISHGCHLMTALSLNTVVSDSNLLYSKLRSRYKYFVVLLPTTKYFVHRIKHSVYELTTSLISVFHLIVRLKLPACTYLKFELRINKRYSIKGWRWCGIHTP